MASDKRPILSGKRARNRRKRAAQRALHEALPVSTPECDSEPDAKQLQLADSRGESVGSGKTTSQSEEEEDDDDDGLVFVCRPTMPDFCTTFLPRADEAAHARSRKASAAAPDCMTFTVRIPAFRETREGFITYTLALATCDEPRRHFQLERRFSEFVAFAAEINRQLASGTASRYCERQEDEETKTAGAEEAGFQWELPAKTWFRVTQPSALEERRAQLERSLETLLLQQERRVCNLPVLRDFLMLDIFGVQVAEEKNRALTLCE
ncbi:hypothetical protein BBJ28_00004066 [Nothophytophthora sp. Chile5]|nr:hypothetical protein BBJ28_00004066 [Nothophytophthora sp. Chile5]